MIPGLVAARHGSIVAPPALGAKGAGRTRGVASHTARVVPPQERMALACYRPMGPCRQREGMDNPTQDLQQQQPARSSPDSTHVVFGTGPIGLAVIDELVERGLRVRAVNRSGAAPVPSTVEVIGGDAADEAFARRAARDADVVYQCLNPGYDRWVEQFPPLQRSVVAAAESAGARLVVLENLYMYRHDAGSPIDERRPEDPHTVKGKLRKSMSDELRWAMEAGRVPIAIGRASNYFGPRAGASSNLGDRVVPRIVAGKRVSLLGDPETRHSHSYLPDIGHALVTLGTDDRAVGQVWHLPNAAAVSTRDLIDLMASAAGTEVAVGTVPRVVVRLLALVNPMVRESLEMLFEYDQPFVVDSSRFTETFGIEATPLAEAAAATIAWHRRTAGDSAGGRPAPSLPAAIQEEVRS